MMREFLPISRDDMKKRGWDELDFVYVIGDAYVDHPSFGPCYHQPGCWRPMAIKWVLFHSRTGKIPVSDGILGVPRLGFLCQRRQYGFHGESLYAFQKKASSGCLYAGGRLSGKRPDYATVVYW